MSAIDPSPEAALPTRPRLGIPAGIRSVAIGAFWFSLMSVFVRLAGRRMPSMEVVLWRGIGTLVLSWVALRSAGVPLWGTNKRMLLLRAGLGWLALSCFYFSLVHIPLGEATLIQYMNPLFATLLSAVFLGEHVGRSEVACVAASLTGVVFIAQPRALFGTGGGSIAPGHLAIALLGAFCTGAAYTAVRRMATTEHRLVVVFYLPLVTVPLTLPFAAADWRWPHGWEWALLAAIGITTQLAQVYFTRGLQLERAARATATG